MDAVLRLAEQLEESILWISSAGQILFANPAARRFLQRPEEELVGLPLRNLLAAGAEAEDYLRECAAGEEFVAANMNFRLGDGAGMLCRYEGSRAGLETGRRDVILRIRESEGRTPNFGTHRRT